jgi:hypothetical protein
VSTPIVSHRIFLDENYLPVSSITTDIPLYYLLFNYLRIFGLILAEATRPLMITQIGLRRATVFLNSLRLRLYMLANHREVFCTALGGMYLLSKLLKALLKAYSAISKVKEPK